MPHRIIFINRYFLPDSSATSALIGDLAFTLVKQGGDVRVIKQAALRRPQRAASNTRDDPGCLGPARSRQPVRRAQAAGPRIGLSVVLCIAGWMLFRMGQRGDVVVATTDPPMLSVLVASIARVKGFAVVNWLLDIYPEIAAKLGVIGMRGPLGHALARLRNRSLRRCAANVVIGEDMALHLRKMGVPSRTIQVIPNWADDGGIRPGDGPALRQAWGLEGKFVIEYAGNLGRAYGRTPLPARQNF